jgi:site-specific DNA-methyltransferase (adenine-specific)
MSKVFFENPKIKIINDDVISTNEIVEKSIDLIITSPPYNVDIKYNTQNDKISYEDYLEFSEKWIARCFEWLKEDGRFCLNIPLDKNKNGQQSVGADLTTIAKKLGFKYHSTIVWNEGNISRRTAWGSWKSASAPFVIAPVELIVILYKNRWKKTSGSRVSDITKEDFMNWTNGLWSFSGESKKRTGHPAPFPVELPKRCIKLFSFVDDVVLDPFLGSGSTLVATALNNRKGIGIDIDLVYCKLAKKRLIKEANIFDTVLVPVGEHDENKRRKRKVSVRLDNGILQEKPTARHQAS